MDMQKSNRNIFDAKLKLLYFYVSVMTEMMKWKAATSILFLGIVLINSTLSQVLNPPQNIFYHNNCDEVMLCWSAPEPGPDSVINYNIYKNGVFFASSEDSCELLNLQAGVFFFEVSAVYAAGESDSIPISFILPDYEAPSNLNYTVNDTGALVLHWDPVYMSTVQNNYWLYYDNGINTRGIGTCDCFLWASIMFDSAMIVPYYETWATHLQFYSYQGSYESWYKVHAWTGEEGTQEILSQDVGQHFIDKWNTIKFDNPLPMFNMKKFYCGYKVWAVASEYPLGQDDTEGISGFGDLLSMDDPSNGTWESIGLYGAQFDYNWNIRLILTSDTANQSHFLGYRVYCDGEKINNLHIIDTLFVVPESITLNNNTFEVTANYISCESEPAVIVYNPTLLNENDPGYVSVYPNPTNGWVNVASVIPINIVNVYSTAGDLVRTYDITKNNVSIDLSSLSKGCYVVHAIMEDGSSARRKVFLK